MTKNIDRNSGQGVGALRDDALDTVIGGGTTFGYDGLRIRISTTSSQIFNPFSPILLPPNPC